MNKPAKSFHREDLRGELLEAACQYVAEHGHEGLSVRKLAQIVGVSPGAPYHHFPDRRSLLLAVAMVGYDELMGAEVGADDESLSPETRLFRLGRFFLHFAARNPRLFALMYESELTRPQLDPQIAKAQSIGFTLLRNAVLAFNIPIVQEELGVRIAAIWSTIYGFTLLRDRGMIQSDHEIDDPRSEWVADAIVKQAIRLIHG